MFHHVPSGSDREREQLPNHISSIVAGGQEPLIAHEGLEITF
jgi:hypothetical protein